MSWIFYMVYTPLPMRNEACTWTRRVSAPGGGLSARRQTCHFHLSRSPPLSLAVGLAIFDPSTNLL